MGTSARKSLISKEAQAVPGPGNYESAKNFGQDAQSVS
jgi:hypothetical protein